MDPMIEQEFDPLQSSLGEPYSWQLLPEGLMYKSYLAGEKEPRFSTMTMYQQHGETFWDSVLGGRVGLVRYGTTDNIRPQGYQWDIEGGAFLRMQPQEDRDVHSVDFRMGSPITYRNGPWQAKLGYYHISSHLGDEFLLKNPGFPRLNYSRDAIVMGMGYFPVDELRLYFEVGWAFFGTGGAKPWELQTGIDYSPTHPTTRWYGDPYAGMNILIREEYDWGGAFSLVAGRQWRGHTSDHTFRAGLLFYNGADNQSSFQGQTTQFLGLGIRYDY